MGLDANRGAPVVDQHVDAISHNLQEFNTLLSNQPIPSYSLSKQEKKAHSRAFNVIALSSLVGAMGCFVKLNPPATISRAHNHTRTMGIVEGAAILGPLIAPLGTAVTVAFLWYKFNNLLHYQCKTERERDMQKISEIATQNKTELHEAFEKYKRNIDQSLVNIRQETKMLASINHQQDIQQIEAYKKIMEENLERITNNLTTVQNELISTAHTNSALKQKLDENALPLLQKISVEIVALKKQTGKQLSKIATGGKAEKHKRENSGILCLLTHHHSRQLSWHETGNIKKQPQKPTHSSDEKSDT
jgi:hypothetical protein